MRSLFSRCLIIFVALFIAGCQSKSVYKNPERIDLVGISYQAATILAGKAKIDLPAGSTILSTSLADIDSLTTTSTLGRIISEQLSSSLSDQGYQLIEIKMRDSVYIDANNGGEFTLSRKLGAISRSNNANAIMAGTYAIGSKTVYINARLIDSSNNMVLATVDFQIPIDMDIRMLITPNRY